MYGLPFWAVIVIAICATTAKSFEKNGKSFWGGFFLALFIMLLIVGVFIAVIIEQYS